MIQNTADYKEDFMKTLYKKSSSLKNVSDKTRMSLKNNIKKKERIIWIGQWIEEK